MRGTSGFALILVLAVTALVAAVGLELSREVRLSAALAANFQDRTRAHLKALDGLSAAAQALLQDDRTIDALDDPWTSLSETIASGEIEEAGFQVEVTDQTGLVNINLLIDPQSQQVRQVWVAILERIISSLEHDPRLVQGLLDWLDVDEITRPGGAEDDAYAEAGRKLKPRNGPLLDVRELGLIFGFDRDLLEGSEERPGLLSLVTIHGQTQINVNTAPVLVLWALSPEMNETVVQEILDLRTSGGLENLNELRQVSGMTQPLFEAISPLLRVNGQRFAARSEGRSGKARYRLGAILERSDEMVKVIASEAVE